MSDEVNRRSDLPNEPTSLDPGPGAGGGEDASPLPGIDWTVATPVDPGMEQGAGAPLPGHNPDEHSERVPGATVPIITGGGGTSGGGGVVLHYKWDLTGALPHTPKTSCPAGDYVTITPKYKAMDVRVFNGWRRVKFKSAAPPGTPVTYTGCYTHYDVSEPENIGRYSVHGILDGVAFSDL